MAVASQFVAAFTQQDPYFTRVDGIKQKAEYLKAGPYEITSGTQAYGLLKKDPIVTQGIGSMLKEQALQADQVRANQGNNTGSPYLATNWVNSFMAQSNYQNLINEQKKRGSRQYSSRYLSIPLLLLLAVMILFAWRRFRV